LERLEELIERGNVERVQLKEKVWGLQAKAGELEKLWPGVGMFQREKGDYEEWKNTGVHRAELVRELKGVEEDHAWLQMRVLEMEREQKEYEKELEGRRQELVEKVMGVGENSERVWARASELEGVEQEHDQVQAHVLELEEVLGELMNHWKLWVCRRQRCWWGVVQVSVVSPLPDSVFTLHFLAILPILRTALVQNAEFCEHIQVFQNANLWVRTLLEAAEKDPAQETMYLGVIKEESLVLALHMLVLPQLLLSSGEVVRLEENLGWLGGSREGMGSKCSGEGSGEGSEAQRKQARRVLDSEV